MPAGVIGFDGVLQAVRAVIRLDEPIDPEVAATAAASTRGTTRPPPSVPGPSAKSDRDSPDLPAAPKKKKELEALLHEDQQTQVAAPAAASASSEAAAPAAATASSEVAVPAAAPTRGMPPTDDPYTEPEADYGEETDVDAEGEPPIGKEIVEGLEKIAEESAKEEDDLAEVMEIGAGVADAMEERKKHRTEEQEAAPAVAAADAAPTRDPNTRRRLPRSRILVTKGDGSEKYVLVQAATESVAAIEEVLDARRRAIEHEAWDRFRASTPEEARQKLVESGDICLVRARDGHQYMVLSGKLQKRSRYYAFCDWASTPDGDWPVS